MKPVVNAGFEVTVPKDHQYDKTYHHSPGSLTSSLGASHMMWRPRRGTKGNLLDANSVVQKPMKETVVGSLQVQIHSLKESPTDINNAYVRLGCLLPLGAQSGRWPRYHTKHKIYNSREKLDIVWNEGIEVAIVQFEDNQNDENIIMFPQITLSIRSKKVGWFGSSITLSRICTLAFDRLWNGPSQAWESPLTVPLPHKSVHRAPMQLTLFLKYEPKPDKGENSQLCRAMEDLARELALVATYKNKVLMKPLNSDQIDLFQELEEDQMIELVEEGEDFDAGGDLLPS